MKSRAGLLKEINKSLDLTNHWIQKESEKAESEIKGELSQEIIHSFKDLQ